jgi:hypothetical protein
MELFNDYNIIFLSDSGEADNNFLWHRQNKQFSQLYKWRAKLFFLNYRAGGLGINLTAADTCIIYDRYYTMMTLLQLCRTCIRMYAQFHTNLLDQDLKKNLPPRSYFSWHEANLLRSVS